MGAPHESDEFCDQMVKWVEKVTLGKPFNLFDVGSLDCYEAEWIRARVPGCSAYCFDPLIWPDAKEIAKFQFAIGATDSLASFYGSADGLHSLLPRGELHSTVAVHRLDTFCFGAGIETIDVLVIDTEGTTPDVIESAGAMLSTCKLIIAEVQYDESGHNHDLELAMHVRGFRYLDHSEAGYSAGSQGNDFYVRR